MTPLFIACDGKIFTKENDCLCYEKSLTTDNRPTPEQLEKRKLQKQENEQLKKIILNYMEKSKEPITITEMWVDLVHNVDFLRARLTHQRLSTLTRQLYCIGLVRRIEKRRKVYFELK